MQRLSRGRSPVKRAGLVESGNLQSAAIGIPHLRALRWISRKTMAGAHCDAGFDTAHAGDLRQSKRRPTDGVAVASDHVDDVA